MRFTSLVEIAVAEADVIFICVNTPPKKKNTLTDHSLSMGIETNMTAFFSVVHTIGKTCKSKEKVIVEKSTVPVGTALTLKHIFDQYEVKCQVVSMPEFLAEG